MCILAVIVVFLLVLIAFMCSSKAEGYGRGGPTLDFLPTVGEFPTGEGGYEDEEDLPF